MNWIIAYDITVNRNRNRIAKRLAQEGIRIQRSVFLVEGSRNWVGRLVDELMNEVDPTTDSLQAWPLMETWQENHHGFPVGYPVAEEAFVVG